jgi:hypothetical protein
VFPVGFVPLNIVGLVLEQRFLTVPNLIVMKQIVNLVVIVSGIQPVKIVIQGPVSPRRVLLVRVIVKTLNVNGLR